MLHRPWFTSWKKFTGLFWACIHLSLCEASNLFHNSVKKSSALDFQRFLMVLILDNLKESFQKAFTEQNWSGGKNRNPSSKICSKGTEMELFQNLESVLIKEPLWNYEICLNMKENIWFGNEFLDMSSLW